jgi:hypothetical protein
MLRRSGRPGGVTVGHARALSSGLYAVPYVRELNPATTEIGASTISREGEVVAQDGRPSGAALLVEESGIVAGRYRDTWVLAVVDAFPTAGAIYLDEQTNFERFTSGPAMQAAVERALHRPLRPAA